MRPLSWWNDAVSMASQTDPSAISESPTITQTCPGEPSSRIENAIPTPIGRPCPSDPVATTSGHAVAFGRGTGDGLEVVTVVTRLAGRLADAGGFGDATLDLPAGRWSDVVSARTFDGGSTRLGDLVGDEGLPVALLVRVGDES